jgi:hypothetical protein
VIGIGCFQYTLDLPQLTEIYRISLDRCALQCDVTAANALIAPDGAPIEEKRYAETAV